MCRTACFFSLIERDHPPAKNKSQTTASDEDSTSTLSCEDKSAIGDGGALQEDELSSDESDIAEALGNLDVDSDKEEDVGDYSDLQKSGQIRYCYYYAPEPTEEDHDGGRQVYNLQDARKSHEAANQTPFPFFDKGCIPNDDDMWVEYAPLKAPRGCNLTSCLLPGLIAGGRLEILEEYCAAQRRVKGARRERVGFYDTLHGILLRAREKRELRKEKRLARLAATG